MITTVMTVEMKVRTADHSYCKGNPVHAESVPCSNEACQGAVRRLTEDCTALWSEVFEFRKKVNKLSFNQHTFKDNSEIVQDLTGLPPFPKLMVVFTFVSEFLSVSSGLPPFQSFVMTLMRMRLNLPVHFLSYIFHVPKGF